MLEIKDLHVNIGEETSGATYDRTRLWVLLSDEAAEEALLLTGWGDLKQIQTLGASLTKAGRRPFEPLETTSANSSSEA